MSLVSHNPPATLLEYLSSPFVTTADIAAASGGAGLAGLPGYQQQFGVVPYTGVHPNVSIAQAGAPQLGGGGFMTPAPAGGGGGVVTQGVNTLIGQGFDWLAQRLFGGGASGPPPIANPGTMGAGGGGVVGGAVGAITPEILKMLQGGGSTNGSCGCSRGGGRCGKHEKAPLATFFGGNCPPGRVLKRQPWARDICMKKPRMNPLNPCALRRANRRVTRFAGISAGMLRKLGYTVQAKKPLAKIGKSRKRR